MKAFYHKHKDIIWGIIALVVLVALVQKPSVDIFDSSEPFFAEDMAVQRASFGESLAAEEERKIRHTGHITLEAPTKQYVTVKKELLALPDVYEGYYTSQNEYATSGKRTYKTFYFTFKVPVEYFNDALREVQELTEVNQLRIDATDLTQNYQDVQGYLSSYKKEKARIEQLLAQAKDIGDIIQIESKLLDIQRTIDRYQQQLLNLERQTDYATITVTLEEQRPTSDVFFEWTGLKGHLRNVVEGFDYVLVLISSSIGWIVALLAIVFVVRKVRKH